MNSVFTSVSLTDARTSVVDTYPECKKGMTLRDYNSGYYKAKYATEASRKIHDANFAFVVSKLSKTHTQVYEPKSNVTYAMDVPIDVGGGLKESTDWYTVEWLGNPTPEQNMVGNNVNVIQRVNAKLNHKQAEVYTFEIAYDVKFIEIDMLKQLDMTKQIEAIYKDGILVGWDNFCQRIAYLGNAGNNGLFTFDELVYTTVLPVGSADPTVAGLESMTDTEVVGTINGILTYYLINTNNNFDLLPDTFLVPSTDASDLSGRFSDLYTSTLRQFLMNFNVGVDEARANGYSDFNLKIKGRPFLNGAGTNGAGRIVAYKMAKENVRMDMTYPLQMYYTGPNIDKACYTTIFVGQVGRVVLPYNTSNDTIGAVTYWDFAAPEPVIP